MLGFATVFLIARSIPKLSVCKRPTRATPVSWASARRAASSSSVSVQMATGAW